MSINFNDEMNDEAMKFFEDNFNPVKNDRKTALFDELANVHQEKLKEFANKAKQPVTLELNEIGDKKEVGGIVYELTELGWKRLPIGTVLEK